VPDDVPTTEGHEGGVDVRHPTRVDIIDETFVRVDPGVVRVLLEQPGVWAALWPHLELAVSRDRGPKGWRWDVTGQVEGEMEVWIERWWDGAIVHHYVRGVRMPGAPTDVQRRHVLRWKAWVHRMKDAVERRPL
jgi:hypothetical protein